MRLAAVQGMGSGQQNLSRELLKSLQQDNPLLCQQFERAFRLFLATRPDPSADRDANLLANQVG